MTRTKNERGMVIIEATFVFPIMFLVIFFMVFAGNAFYVRSKVDSIVTELTIKGAAYCATPMLREVANTGNIPGYGSFRNEPYRHLFWNNPAEAIIEAELGNRLSNVSTGLFSGMRPILSPATVSYNNKYIYSTFSISLEHKIRIPIRILGTGEFIYLRTVTHAETAVSDVPEFMRNINTIEDYLLQTGISDKIAEAINKVKGLFG